jgi:hypothetical protein
MQHNAMMVNAVGRKLRVPTTGTEGEQKKTRAHVWANDRQYLQEHQKRKHISHYAKEAVRSGGESDDTNELV